MADITCKNCGTIINIKKAQKGVVICPNCEVENECSEQIYEYASELMASAGNELTYKAAAEAFSLIEGYRDADMYRDNCLEQASICFKDATFLRAKTEMMKGDRAGLSFACHLLESISGWKDADEQLGICRMRLEALSANGKNGSADNIYSASNKKFVKKDRRSAENANTLITDQAVKPAAPVDFPVSFDQADIKVPDSGVAKPEMVSNTFPPKKKKLNSIIIASSVAVILIGVLAAVYFVVIAPMLKYDKAIDFINNGEYEEGYAILSELGREDEILDNKKDRAHKFLEEKDFDKAYSLLSEIGEENEITDSILLRVSESVENKNYSDAIKTLTDYSYPTLPEKRYKKAGTLIDEGKFDEAYILLSSNSFDGSESLRASIKHVDIEIKFLGKKKGDIVELGKFELDGNTENGDENITWKIIDETSDSYLVLSESIVDCQMFDGRKENVNWTVSYIRKLLNLGHFPNMFNAREKALILEKNVPAAKNPSYDTEPGEDSACFLFLLSSDEVSRLMPDNSSRKVSGNRFETEPENMNWWLRTPGAVPGSMSYVDLEGNISLEGAPANLPFFIRPAMWVKKP